MVAIHDPAAMSGAGHGEVRLHVIEPGRLADADAARLLGPDAGTWLGSPVADPPRGMRRFAVDLHLRPDDRGPLSAVHREAYIDLGASEPSHAGMRVEISWRSLSLAPLFPVFSGWLTVAPGELRLDGYYAPPGGALGRVADRALLHLAARGTARWLLRQLNMAAEDGVQSPSPPAKSHGPPPQH
jgi:hypothetical protein